MSSMTVTIVAFLLMVNLIGTADANAFLKAHHSSEGGRMSEEDVQTSLLAEVEGTFGEGSASSRVKQLEAALGPIFAALPKNEKGFLGHATVRYALHRLFVQRHGWSIKGLDVSGGHRNSTSGAGLLKEQVPAYIQDLFEKRLAGRGFGLHELGVLAATIEHLVHSETIKRLGDAFKVHNFLPTSVMSTSDADEVLDTYMAAYILAEDVSNMTLDQVNAIKKEMPEMYGAWKETQEFVRTTRQASIESDSSTEQKASGQLDFALLARVAERIGEQFGKFQDQECQQIKKTLVNIEEPGTGRVLLSNFYKPSIGGHWQFSESLAYLRALGALDETAEKPRVIIPNYVTSPSNCIASSSFYSVCCMDECEGLLGHLEKSIAAPEATSTEIAKLVSELSSTTVVAPRKLSPTMLERLGDIAAQHAGSIPLHGRLFTQWMHHAFPRECRFPHISGTTNPMSASEWIEATGEQETADHEEMLLHVEKAAVVSSSMNKQHQEDEQIAAMPWSLEEELLFSRPRTATGNTLLANIRRALLFTALSAIAFGLAVQARTSLASPMGGVAAKAEKFMV